MDSLMPLASSQRVASRYLQASAGPLPKLKMVRLVNRVLQQADLDGMHRDQYWRPIQRIWKLLEEAGIPFSITKTEYEKENGVPVRKVWLFEVPFLNERGRPSVVYGRVIASGAGSVEDPLETYDVTAYAS